MTFKIWKTFQQAFPEASELDHSYQVRIVEHQCSPPFELASIQRQMTSLPFSALTSLSLGNMLLKNVHLNDLTNLSNLAVLALQQGFAYARPDSGSGIDEQFMKRWGQLVQEKNAFMKLKVIVFRQFKISLDSTLDCFGMFPCLLLCNANSPYPLHEPARIAKTWRLLSNKRFGRISNIS